MELTMDTQGLHERLETLSAQVAFLVEQQKKRQELYDELSPILREVLGAATEKLDAVEKRGWLQFAGALGEVATRILDHYSADDVRALGGAIVAILDTVRAMTQPEVLAIVGEAGAALQHADEAQPIGMLGMMRASRDGDVQKGMAVLMELLRHVGRATQKVAEKGPRDRKERLAAALGPRRKRTAPQLPAHPPAHAPAPAAKPESGAAKAPACHVPKVDAPVGDWSRDQAEALAGEEGVTLGPEHWRLIELARADFEKNGVAANIRRLTQLAGFSTKDLFALFPKAPGRTIARIAGTPKPAGCI
jgi:tRNA 2-thiouridine synthesizing protein E